MTTFAQITNDWIELASGRRLHFEQPDPAAISVEDIAHHLSQVNRYGGAPRRPYSVAEHAVLVAERLRSQGHDAATILAGLHHDDAEAFVGDIVRPIKRSLSGYSEIEDAVQAAVRTALDLTLVHDEAAVSAADDWALSCEAWHLLPSRGEEWCSAGIYSPDHDAGKPLWRCTWRRARRRYLRLHRVLTKATTC